MTRQEWARILSLVLGFVIGTCLTQRGLEIAAAVAQTDEQASPKPLYMCLGGRLKTNPKDDLCIPMQSEAEPFAEVNELGVHWSLVVRRDAICTNPAGCINLERSTEYSVAMPSVEACRTARDLNPGSRCIAEDGGRCSFVDLDNSNRLVCRSSWTLCDDGKCKLEAGKGLRFFTQPLAALQMSVGVNTLGVGCALLTVDSDGHTKIDWVCVERAKSETSVQPALGYLIWSLDALRKDGKLQ